LVKAMGFDLEGKCWVIWWTSKSLTNIQHGLRKGGGDSIVGRGKRSACYFKLGRREGGNLAFI